MQQEQVHLAAPSSERTSVESASVSSAAPQVMQPGPFRLALDVSHKNCHRAADAFWDYWRANGETHRHGYYESTWGAINRAIRMVGVVPHDYGLPPVASADADALANVPVDGGDAFSMQGLMGLVKAFAVQDAQCVMQADTEDYWKQAHLRDCIGDEIRVYVDGLIQHGYAEGRKDQSEENGRPVNRDEVARVLGYLRTDEAAIRASKVHAVWADTMARAQDCIRILAGTEPPASGAFPTAHPEVLPGIVQGSDQ